MFEFLFGKKNTAKPSTPVKKNDRKIDHLKVKDHSRNQVYTPVGERKEDRVITTTDVIVKKQGERVVTRKNVVAEKNEEVIERDVYKIVGFINAFNRIPDFAYLVYEFGGRYYIESQNNETGIVEEFIKLNDQEVSIIRKFDDVTIYNGALLTDSYVGKDGTDCFLLSEDELYVDTILNFKEMISDRYRLANLDVTKKVLSKK